MPPAATGSDALGTLRLPPCGHKGRGRTLSTTMKVPMSIRRFQVRCLSKVPCEGSHMRNFGRLVVGSTLYPPPLQGVVPTQHSHPHTNFERYPG